MAYNFMIRPEGNLIKFLGPSFATKYLYFVGGGSTAHTSLILDTKVARVLRDKFGITWLPEYGWSAEHFQRYCNTLNDWAKEKTKEVGREVGGDEFELWLFKLG